jgi:hypothetical protein
VADTPIFGIRRRRMPSSADQPSAEIPNASLSVGEDLVRMMRADGHLQAGVLGGDRLLTPGSSPTIAIDPTPPGIEMPTSVPIADVVLIPRGFEEDRGRFSASYLALDVMGTVESEVKVEGFLLGDEAKIAKVASDTYDRAGDGSEESPFHVRYEADVENGAVKDARRLVDPFRIQIMNVGLAGGRLYDLDVERPLDVSGMPREKIDGIVGALVASDDGIVTVEGRMYDAPGGGERVGSADIVDPSPEDAMIEGQWRAAMQIRSETDPDFEQSVRDAFLFKGIDGYVALSEALFEEAAGESQVRILPPSSLEELKVVDRGHLAELSYEMSRDLVGEAEIVPVSFEAAYAISPGVEPKLSSMSMAADRFAEIDGVRSRSTRLHAEMSVDGVIDIDERWPRQSVSLSAQGGRLYAVVDDYRGPHAADAAVYKVSEVVDGLAGGDLAKSLREVTAQEGVHLWPAAMIGEVGDGPVRVGLLDQSQVGDHSRIRPDHLKGLDRAVAAFRKDEGHVSSILSQAQGIAPGSSEKVASVGPETREGPGLVDRMKRLVGGLGGR